MTSAAPLALLSTIVFGASVVTPQQAHARPQDPSVDADFSVGPGTRGMFATFSLAPAIALSSSVVTQLKIAQTFGYHFSGNATGFAIGAELQESFAGGAFALNVGPKAWYDFAVSRNYGVYIAPTVMMGLGYASFDTYYGSSSAAAFDMQFGIEAKVILADRGLLFIRPMTIDIGVGPTVAVRYDLVFGGGATF